MLLEFSVSNYRSFKNKQTFSMISKNKEVSFETNIKKIPFVLRKTAIMGPNASGKSNFIQALSLAKRIVKKSHSYDLDRKINTEPYLLNDDFLNKSSEFEFVVLEDNVIYQYGFSTTRDEIQEEWLFATKKGGNLQKWILREGDDKKNWYINPNLKGNRKDWIKEARHNSLLLSTIATLKNQEQLKIVLKAIVEKINVISSTEKLPSIITKVSSLKEDEVKSKVLLFLKNADLGIADFICKEEEFSPALLPKEMPQSLKDELIEKLSGKKTVESTMQHKSENGAFVNFDFEEQESDGTKVLFALAAPIIDVLETGETLIVDELDRSMHFKEMEYIENLFSNKETNPNNAQLIFSAHDVSIFERLVKEEIYLVDKPKSFYSELYPLTDFENRKDIPIDKRYKAGSYKALPKIGRFLDV